MKPAPLVALSALSLGLLGYAFYVLTLPSAPRPRRAAPAPAAAPSPRYEAEAAPIVRIAEALAREPVALEEEVQRPREAAPAPEGPGEIDGAEALALGDRAAAEAAFERAMEGLAAIEGPKAIGQERRAQLYREVNDAFTALSVHLGSGPEVDLEALEAAFQRMQAEVGRLDLRKRPKRPSQE